MPLMASMPGDMAELWTFAGESVSLLGPQGGTVTLVEEASFCISGRSGDIVPGGPQGLFFRDTRFLSTVDLHVNGHRPEVLAAERTAPFSATFVLRTPPVTGRAECRQLPVIPSSCSTGTASRSRPPRPPRRGNCSKQAWR